MLAWLLLLPLHAFATPPPLPTGDAPRIEGLTTTYVTPEAFVGGLHPMGSEAPAAVVELTLAANAPVDAAAVAAALGALDGVTAEAIEGRVRIAPGTSGIDIPQQTVPSPEGDRTIASLGTLTPLPVVRLRMPNGAPPAPAMAHATGHDLVLSNPIFGSRVEVQVQGTRIGVLRPMGVAVLHDVRPGDYEVVYLLDTGHAERRTVASRPAKKAPAEGPVAPD